MNGSVYGPRMIAKLFLRVPGVQSSGQVQPIAGQVGESLIRKRRADLSVGIVWPFGG